MRGGDNAVVGGQPGSTYPKQASVYLNSTTPQTQVPDGSIFNPGGQPDPHADPPNGEDRDR